jgi:hypothetical protein
MTKHSAAVVAVAALSFAGVAVPAGAQSFQNASAEPIWSGDLRLTGSPVQMFGRDGAPDRTGGAFRLGYGFSDWFDVEGKSAFFDGVSLVGADGHFRLFRDDNKVLSASIGGHRAVMTSAPDSTALDLGLGLRDRLNRRVQVYGGAVFSWETINSPGGTDFTRFHLVPGVRVGITERLDLLVEGGVGLNHNSPHYVTAGLALNMPVSDSARSREH